MNEPRHRLRWNGALCVAVLFALTAGVRAIPQEAASSPSTAAPQDSEAKTAKPAKKRYRHADDFLIRGTVFNEKALSFPGVQLRIRVRGQKKYRWETYTNSRGEFAVRVPQGADYEVLAHVKGFADQARAINARNGGDEETVVFRMQAMGGGKK